MSGELGVDELRSLFLFEQLTDEQLAWIAERADVRTFDEGVVVYREGEPATHLYILLAGRLQVLRMISGENVEMLRTEHRGAYAGAIRAYVEPDAVYGQTLVTTQPSSFLRLRAEDFALLMRAWFPMAVHLLDGLYLGMRSSEAQIRQREHLAQLGTLSANLAHELNNPAAAAVRATAQLRERVAAMRNKLGLIAAGDLDRAAIVRLVDVQQRAVARAAKKRDPLSPIERADAEDELVDCLEGFEVRRADDLAEVLVSGGFDAAWVDEVAEALGTETLDSALHWIGYTLETEALMDEIEDASGRISTMVGAVKQYSHMDSATHADVDLHPGLESTVVMLGHKLAGIRVVREFDQTLSPVPAYAAELNQVWTNLIDNAADAMGGEGVLTLRTRRDGDYAVVEVSDDGPGIPDEIRGRIFDAFFTTKPAGSGSGLGLDNARRIIVQRHDGALDVTTSAAGTTFAARLPLTRE
jgi:signal transduction histidine kinase